MQATEIRVRQAVFTTGERFPVLLDGDGFPLSLPTRYIIDRPRTPFSLEVIDQVAAAIGSVVALKKAARKGHPLSLALLVERLRPAKDGFEVSSILENAPAYGGHIEKSYQVFWESIRRDSETRSMLARWARLQGSFALQELLEVFESDAVEKTLVTARPYLRATGAETVDFFHNSFRQFVLTETRKSNLGIDENAAIHLKLSKLFGCSFAINVSTSIMLTKQGWEGISPSMVPSSTQLPPQPFQRTRAFSAAC